MTSAGTTGASPNAAAVPYRPWHVDAVGAGVCAVLAAAAYFLGAAPLLERHARYQAQQVELGVQHRRAADAASELAVAKKQLAALQDALAASPLQLQPASVVNQRLALLTNLATEHGIGLDDVQPGRIHAGKRFDTVPIRVAGTGTYRTCAALLHRLRERFPDTGVYGWQVSGTPSDPSGVAKFQVDLIWYTAPSATTGAGGGAGGNGGGNAAAH